MPPDTNPKALVTNEAMQTIGLAAFGIAFVGFMLIGGVFIAVGLTVAVGCSVLIVVLHFGELRNAVRQRRFSRHLALPLAAVILVPLSAVMVANKDPILHAFPAAAIPMQDTHAAVRAIRRANNDLASQIADDDSCHGCSPTRRACEKKREKLISGLNGLDYDEQMIVYYQQLKPDSAELHDKYIEWAAHVSSFLRKNENEYLSRAEFETAEEPGAREDDLLSQLMAKEIVLRGMTEKASAGLCDHEVLRRLQNGTF